MARRATIHSITIQLSQLLAKIDKRLLGTLASAQSIAPHETNRNPLIDDLSRWQHQLDQLQRRLAQAGNTLDSRESRMRSVPRNQRYRERQAIESHRDSLTEAENVAGQVRMRLRQLTHRTLVPGDVEVINRSFDLLDDHIKELMDMRGWIDKAHKEGRLSASDAMQMRSVLSDSGARFQNPGKVQVVGPDWLLMLTLVLRLAQMALLKIQGDQR